MKNLFRITLLILLIPLAIAVAASCGGNVQPDDTAADTGDITTNEGGGTAEIPVLKIIDEGKTAFQIVRGENASSDEKAAAVKLKKFIAGEVGEVTITDDWLKPGTSAPDYEILVGETNREGEGYLTPDRELLGKGGYIIAARGTKIFILGGSDSATSEAVDKFISGWQDGTYKSIPEGQTDYFCMSANLSGITLGGTDIGDFCLYLPEGSSDEQSAMLYSFRKAVFTCTGTMLEYTSEGTGKRIVPAIATGSENIVSVTVSGDTVTLKTNATLGGERLAQAFKEEILETAEGVLKLEKDFVYEKNYGEIVTYKQFGAVGDGKTDDTDAIYATHEYANKNGCTVFADAGAVYYIGPKAKRITVKTDTDWTDAEFIIDDRNVENNKLDIFCIASDNESYTITGIKSLKAGQTDLGIKLPGDSTVKIINGNVKRYIRYGANANSGSAQTEIIRVDKNGKVDPNTPIIWDYDVVTSATGYRIDEKVLTIRGGTFTTIANQQPSTYDYYSRGIYVCRSNTVIDGVTHKTTGEGSTGAPYAGFLYIANTSDVTIKNCVFTGHKTYKDTGTAGTSMGSYEINVSSSTNLTVENCTQTNDINDSTYWGVFASNFAKNIIFDGNVFSRFDAHQGVMNVTIRNCKLGHQGINLIGSGKAIIENTTVYASAFINLRSDYGSTWNGDIVINDCVFYPKNGSAVSAVNLISATNPETHDFGYTCYLPTTVTINGLYIRDSNVKSYTGPKVFSAINTSHTSGSTTFAYPMVITEKITASGITSDSGKALEISTNTYLFRNTVLDIK